MNEKEKEKLVIEYMFKYLAMLDREASKTFWTQIGLFASVIAFLINMGIWKIKTPGDFLYAVILVIIYIFHYNNQTVKYVDDLYQEFLKSIKDNNILGFSIKPIKWHNKYFLYKKKY